MIILTSFYYVYAPCTLVQRYKETAQLVEVKFQQHFLTKAH